jgi:hypothetical protein
MESRVQQILDSFASGKAHSALETMEHLALLKRWYYRSHRIGEIFLVDEKGAFPMRRIVRGIGRILRGEGPEQDLAIEPSESNGNIGNLKLKGRKDENGDQGIARQTASRACGLPAHRRWRSCQF